MAAAKLGVSSTFRRGITVKGKKALRAANIQRQVNKSRAGRVSSGRNLLGQNLTMTGKKVLGFKRGTGFGASKYGKSGATSSSDG